MVSKSVREEGSTISNRSKNENSAMQPLIEAMQQAIAGNFSVRLDENNGLGEIAVVFNQWVSCNENFANP
jgi:methyl-accepting chemotaxis protein